jgi:hypothetical protein
MSAKNYENRDSNLSRKLLKYQVKSYLVPGRGTEFSLQAIDSKELNLSIWASYPFCYPLTLALVAGCTA